MLGYAASYCGLEDNNETSRRLQELSKLISNHELIRPIPVNPPNERLAIMEQNYAAQAKAMLAQPFFPQNILQQRDSPIHR